MKQPIHTQFDAGWRRCEPWRELLTFPHVFKLIMQLIDAIEAEIGHPVEAWPTQILTIIFAFYPHMAFALIQLEKVIAFFYGNNMPVNMACQFFAACSYFPLRLTEHSFTYFYSKWSEHPHLCADCMYYNLNEQKFKHVDEFDDIIPTCGYEATGFPSIARNILIQANQEYVEGDV